MQTKAAVLWETWVALFPEKPYPEPRGLQFVLDEVAQTDERAKTLTPGDPMDKKTRLGALVSKKQRDTVLSYTKKGVEEGAALVAGGKSVSPGGSILRPE